MVIICSICLVNLNFRSLGVPRTQFWDLIGTNCGHLFHQSCLLTLFEQQRLNHLTRHCPKCWCYLRNSDVRLIYPCRDSRTEPSPEQLTMLGNFTRELIRQVRHVYQHYINEVTNLRGANIRIDYLQGQLQQLTEENNRLRQQQLIVADIIRANEEICNRERRRWDRFTSVRRRTVAVQTPVEFLVNANQSIFDFSYENLRNAVFGQIQLQRSPGMNNLMADEPWPIYNSLPSINENVENEPVMEPTPGDNAESNTIDDEDIINPVD